MTREERVQAIMRLMRDLQWETGRTGGILANKWGLSEGTLKQYAAEASRRVRAEVNDPDFVGATVGQALLEVVKKHSGPGGDSRHVIGAAKVWADIAGASAPNRTEVSFADGLPDDPAELRAMAARLLVDEPEAAGQLGEGTEAVAVVADAVMEEDE